jgi:8-oxo-dGTP diphosphatase
MVRARDDVLRSRAAIGHISAMPPHDLVDRAYRLVYRLGFRLMRLWWGLRRPDHYGAIVAVWHDGRVLMLRQSYRRALVFPGGGLERDESLSAGACRELVEEIGIVVAPEALSLVREMTALWDGRRDHVAIFELHLDALPTLRLDGREIVAGEFMTPAAALAAILPPFERAYLAARATT